MVYDIPAMNIGEDVYTVEDFAECRRLGIFIPSDGDGYWGTETHYTYEGSVWREAPAGATHVHWYNK